MKSKFYLSVKLMRIEKVIKLFCLLKFVIAWKLMDFEGYVAMCFEWTTKNYCPAAWMTQL